MCVCVCVLFAATFERCDHPWTLLLQEALQLLPGSLQNRVVLHVSAQVSVVLLKQTVPGHAALQPVRTEHANTQTHTDYGGDKPQLELILSSVSVNQQDEVIKTRSTFRNQYVYIS